MTPATAGSDGEAPFRVLLIEDNPGDARLIALEFNRVRDITFQVRAAATLANGITRLCEERYDLVLLDLSLPDSRGLESLDRLIQCGRDVPVVILTGLDDETLAIEALRRGAQDYIIKGKIDQRMLTRAVRYATERAQATAHMRAAHAKFKLMFDESPVGFVFSTRAGEVLQANQAFQRIAGRSDIELDELNIWEMLSTRAHPGEAMAAPSERRGGPVKLELRHASGDLVPVSVTWAVVEEPEAGPRVWLTLEDLSQYRVIEQRLLQMSMYDALTGLANRNLFQAALAKAMSRAERSQRPLALLMLDLDGFKRINDTLGHEAGDALLRGVAHRLSTRLRNADQVARIGGDEFAVLLENVEVLSGVEVVARKIIAAVTPPFDIDGKQVRCGASIGIAGWPEHARDVSELQRAADLAMYAAKSVGGSAYRFYSEAIRAEFHRRSTLEEELRRAEQGMEFTLHYQPQVDIASGQVTGVEALLRWRHPERGLLCASEFIDGLESSGQIEGVGNWALDTALGQLAAWHRRLGKSLSVSLNLSARQLAQRSLLRHMVNALERSTVDPAFVELELTESAVLSPHERELLDELHTLGIRITIDDFGMGYSSLQYLKLLPIQALKVDRSFVSGLPTRADDVAIVAATIALASSLGLEVIAEGVETPEQLELLRAHGCARAQGRLIGAPLAADEFEAWMQQGKALSLSS